MQKLSIRPRPGDPAFDGIGAVNGGGATSALLKDYPEPQRSQILDLVFSPRHGASVSTLLVEIPGDGNSTQGSMPSHQHSREDSDAYRGYTWWVIAEAKRRNPDITIDAVAWSAPGWLGDGEFWSQDTADYYVRWLELLRDEHGLCVDALGCRNEKGVDLGFAKTLRRTLDRAGFDRVRIHAFDNWPSDKWDFVNDLDADPEAREAIDVIGVHVLYGRPDEQAPPTVRQWAEDHGKPIWNTEDHVYKKGFECLISIVECFNESFLLSGATKTVLWYDIAGVYPIEPYSEDPAMIVAHEPWSGHFAIRPALWGYAHYGQFTGAGWVYVVSACASLEGGGTAVTLRDHNSGEVSIIIETKDAPGPQSIEIELPTKTRGSRLRVWRSIENDVFARQGDLVVTGGRAFIDLEPDAVYSVSTTSGQRHGEVRDTPGSAPFPLPYRDTFTDYAAPAAVGRLPQYTADIAGAFELTTAPDGGPALRQAATRRAISWAPDWHPYTIIGDDAWEEYEVSVLLYLSADDRAGVMGRVNHVGTGYGFVPQCYYLELTGDGRYSVVEVNGKEDKTALVGDAEQQALARALSDSEAGGERVLAAGRSPLVRAGVWMDVSLRFEGARITALVDGQVVCTATDARHSTGMVGLIAFGGEHDLSTPFYRDLRITPLDLTSNPEPTPSQRLALYDLSPTGSRSS